MRLFQTHWTSVLWGSLRNAPLIALFVSAVWHWAREKKMSSIVYVLLGAAISSLLIRSTGPIAGDYGEPDQVTAVTFVTLSLLQVLLVVYLGTEAEWSNCKFDVGLGAMTGISLAVAQGLAPQSPSWIYTALLSVGLGAVAALALLGMRKLKERPLPSALASALLLGAAMTLLIQAAGLQLVLE